MEVSEPPQKGKQLLLERLLSFHGSFTSSAAEFVCGAPPLSKSLVKDQIQELCAAEVLRKYRSGRGWRYQFWFDDVERRRDEAYASPGMGAVRQRHLLWCKKYIVELGKSLKDDRQDMALEKMQVELDNFRAALAWSLRPSADGDDALSLIIASYRFWHVRSHVEEGLEWVLQAIEKAADRKDERMLKALNVAGLMFEAIGKHVEAARMYRKTMELAVLLDNPRAQAIARGNMAHNHAALGKADLARKEYETCIRDLEAIGDSTALASALCNYAILLIKVGQIDNARGLLDKAQAMDLQSGDLWGLNTLNINVAEVLFKEGELDKAESLYCEILENTAAWGDMRTAAEVFSCLARLAVARKSYRRAATLFGAAQLAGEICSLGLQPVDVTLGCTHVGECRDYLGDDEFDERWTEGYEMSFDEAVRFAVGYLSDL